MSPAAFSAFSEDGPVGLRSVSVERGTKELLDERVAEIGGALSGLGEVSFSFEDSMTVDEDEV